MPTAAEPTFGIDFGTTNTRVAYFDGERVRMVPFHFASGHTSQCDTAVAYAADGNWVIGADALAQPEHVRGLKWALDRDEPLETPDGSKSAEVIAADFFRELKRQVARAFPRPGLARAAITIPVHHSYQARQRLADACELAGIEVTHFFFEPIAAMYANLVAAPVAGVAAVFDWGGGSLDIATVQLRDGTALTREVQGWHRGGSHFARLAAGAAVDDFLLQHPRPGMSAEWVLDVSPFRHNLRLRAEQAKKELTRRPAAMISYAGLLGADLEYDLTRDAFEDLIRPDLDGALGRLDQALHATGVTTRSVSRLFLSGGTCNLPAVRDEMTNRFGDRVVTRLELPARYRHPAGGTEDIGNATAVGAALMAAHAARPTFATSIGVRLAGSGADRFYPVFPAGSPVSFGDVAQSFFVTDTTAGVVRLLICDQDDPARSPAGRLLRVIPVPIHDDENWVDVTFRLDRHLVLRVEATGRAARAFPRPVAHIQALNLGFPLPPVAPDPVPPRTPGRAAR